MLKLVAAVLALLGLASVARADDQNFTVLDWTPERMVVQLEGEISFFTGAEFRKIAGARPGGVLLLRSDGGDVNSAMTLGAEIRNLGWTTVVPTGAGCYSACAMIWAAGTERRVGRGAVLGFHGPYREVGDDHITQGSFGNEFYADYYRGLGYSEQAVEQFMHLPPGVFELTKENAAALGVTARFD